MVYNSLRVRWGLVLWAGLFAGACTTERRLTDRDRVQVQETLRAYREAYEAGDVQRVRRLLDDSTPARAKLADAIAEGAGANAAFVRNAQEATPEWLRDDAKDQWEAFSRYRPGDQVGQEEVRVTGKDAAVGAAKTVPVLVVKGNSGWGLRFEPSASENEVLERANEEHAIAAATERMAERAKDDPEQAVMQFLAEIVEVRKMRESGMLSGATTQGK
jgi:hypothetical protein